MNKVTVVLAATLLLMPVAFCHAYGTLQSPYVPGEVIVSWDDATSILGVESTVRDLDAAILDTSRTGGNFARVSVPKGFTVAEFIDEVHYASENLRCEPNYYRYATWVPNDPYLAYQWHFQNINLATAWDSATGSGVTVAVVDTGISNGSDGFYHYVAGYDFVAGDTNPADENGHGTHVAGTIAQKTNNGVGVAGIAFNCNIMAVRVLDAQGSGSVYDVADGIRYAADHGAKVINMSLGSAYGSTIEEDAINYAAALGVVICAASGNEGSSSVGYPARYTNCIAVGATRYDNTRTYYSNYGTGLDVVAPGGDMNVDQNGDGYVDGVLQQTFSGTSWGYYFFEGTSMATPHVAGLAALVLSKFPSYNRDQVRNAIESTCLDLGASGWDNYYGWGLINAAAAVGGSSNPTPTPTNPPTYTPTPAPTSPPSSCTVTITSATWTVKKKTLAVKATCSVVSTLSLYTDGTYQGTLTYNARKKEYTITKVLSAKPYQVTVTSACGGSASVYFY